MAPFIHVSITRHSGPETYDFGKENLMASNPAVPHAISPGRGLRQDLAARLSTSSLNSAGPISFSRT